MQASNLEEFEKMQLLLSEKIIFKDEFSAIDRVAGVDVSYREKRACACGVVMNWNFEILEKKIIKERVNFKYIPTYFALRELQPSLKVLKNLKFDLLFVHGHGFAHPRRFGLACSVGFELGIPTIGIANRKLIGEYDDSERLSYLWDKGERIGIVVRREKMKPIFISVGHKISLKTALKFTLKSVKNHRLPEVLWVAHLLSKKSISAL
ncbi:MAG: endonuclease V [Candidatus Methanofastidiosia archaeon]